MKKIIITLLLISTFAIGADKPTHYFEGKWYQCIEVFITEPRLPKCSGRSKAECADYDAKGNKIHRRWSDGDEWWSDYDSKGNMIHRRDSYGNEWWFKWFFDEKKNKKYRCYVDEKR